jgi:uncharacterized protein (AIM24 family)
VSAPAGYVCRFCRQSSDPDRAACPRCGAPFDVASMVSRSGWEKLPPIKDMVKIQFGQSRLQVEGQQVPVADFALAENDSVYFSHHVLLWSDPSTRLANSSLAQGWTRVLAGLPLIMLEAWGPGNVALSENRAGDVVALPLLPGQQVWTREHRFLAATGGVRYGWQNAQVWFTTGSGNERETHFPLGQFEDVFTAESAPGLLLLHGPGDTFFRDLAPGQTVLIQPSALLYRDASVRVDLHVEYPASPHGAGSFSGWRSQYTMRNVWLRLAGPGRVAVQSIFQRPENAEPITSSSFATAQRW